MGARVSLCASERLPITKPWRGLAAWIALIWLGLLPIEVRAANHDPLLLVHGFLGFGRGEMAGYHEWGGRDDLAASLGRLHPDQAIHAATVGPVSSNRDRAVELFYQIKGGWADDRASRWYGARVTKGFDHLRILGWEVGSDPIPWYEAQITPLRAL